MNIKNEKGLALLTVTILTVFLFAVAATYFDKLMGEKRLALASQNGFNATMIADAVADEVFWRYNFNNFITDPVGNGWTVLGSTAAYGSSGLPMPFLDSSGNTVGNYYATIENYTTAPLLTVNSFFTGGNQMKVGNTSQILAELQEKPVYGGAITAKGVVTIDGDIDSYSSPTAYGGANINDNGDVATISTASPSVSVGNTSTVSGDVATSSSGSIDNDGTITGEESSNALFSIPDVVVPAALIAEPSAGDLSMSGSDVLSWVADDYHYDTINMTGGEITVTGNVNVYISDTSGWVFSTSGGARVTVESGAILTIYTEGNVRMTGDGIVNAAGSTNPQAVQIMGTSTCATVNLSGNNEFAGLVNTPYADVTVGGSSVFYGAIIADTVDANQDIHYDETLLTGGPTNGYELKWYRRVK